jgi:Flp pilus assembly protein TadD
MNNLLMSYLLNKKLDHETACESAIQSGDTRKAIFHAANVSPQDQANAV